MCLITNIRKILRCHGVFNGDMSGDGGGEGGGGDGGGDGGDGYGGISSTSETSSSTSCRHPRRLSIMYSTTYSLLAEVF